MPEIIKVKRFYLFCGKRSVFEFQAVFLCYFAFVMTTWQFLSQNKVFIKKIIYGNDTAIKRVEINTASEASST
jgi:hypothetical protein